MKNEILERAIGLLGGQSNLGRKLNVTQSHVWRWLNSKNGASPKHCIKIEHATGGKVTRYQLRPDVFGPDPNDRCHDPCPITDHNQGR